MSDLDVLKEIPGYKAILKSVLKSQIQLLMEQLSEHAGEESIILTASVNDGSLSHLGSSTGKGFFEGRDEIKSQFLGYCLKTYHKQKTREPPKPYQRKHPSPRTSPSTQPAKRPCVYPVSLSQYSSETYPSSNIETHRLPERRTSQEQTDSTMDLAVGTSGDSSSDTIVKTELNDQNTSNSGPTAVTSAAEFLPSSIHLSHTQGSSETNEGADNENTKNDSSDETRIKVEQLEDELEITGVEMAAGSINHWGQGQPGYIPESDSSYSMPSDQSGYNMAMQTHLTDMFIGTSSNVSLTAGPHLLATEEMPKRSTCIGLVPRTCPYCQKFFASTKDLNRHILIHTGEKPHKCDVCGRDFRLQQHLKNHKISVHNVISLK